MEVIPIVRMALLFQPKQRVAVNSDFSVLRDTILKRLNNQNAIYYMKNLLLVLAFLFSFQIISNAQFGMTVAYKPINAPNWEAVIAQHKSAEPSVFRIDPLSQGIHFGLDYWFRLKKHRIEFLPELSIARFTRIWEKEVINDQITSHFIGLHFNTNIYIFDLKGDCDCPTFSKGGNDFAKGLFFQISPGINYISNAYKQDNTTQKANDIAPSAGIGIGLDIGLSDFLTITPMIKYQWYFNVEWEGLHSLFDTPTPIDASYDTNTINQTFVGVRVGLRFDELNKY